MQSVDDWADDPGVRNIVVTSIRELLPQSSADAEDASDRFFAMTPELLLANLSRTLNPPPNLPSGTNASSVDPFAGGSASGLGGAASFRDVLGEIGRAHV